MAEQLPAHERHGISSVAHVSQLDSVLLLHMVAKDIDTGTVQEKYLLEPLQEIETAVAAAQSVYHLGLAACTSDPHVPQTCRAALVSQTLPCP